MKAVISPDPQRGPGHACILLEGCPAVNGTAFTLRRGSDMKYLAASGWQESEYPLAPDAVDSANGCARLRVGPAVVDQLDALSAYQIGVDGQRFGLEIQQLVYSREHENGGAMPGMPPSPPVSAPAPEPEPAPAPAPEPDPLPAPEPAPQPAPETDPQPLPVQEIPPEPKSRLLPVLLLLLLLLAVAGAAAWYFLVHQRPAAPVPPVPAQTESAPAPRAAPAPTALETARKHLRGAADPAGSLALAKPLRTPEASPEDSDAAFLLLEDAAQKGNAEAMWLVGQFYDPTAGLPRGSIPVDMSLARQWYEKAKTAGVAQADASLKTLRAHVEAEAGKGDMEARMLLQSWK